LVALGLTPQQAAAQSLFGLQSSNNWLTIDLQINCVCAIGKYQPPVPVPPTVPKDPLLECMVKHESSGDENKVNPHDNDGEPAFGLLQFHYGTFFEWCVQKYGMIDNIFDGKIQLACAAKMLDDNQSWRWPTIKKYCKS
jgi:hypothetical protein